MKLEELENFLSDNRNIWTSKEWDLIRMKWFKLEEKYRKAVRKALRNKAIRDTEDNIKKNWII